MTSITDLAIAAFDDYNTHGVSASGVKKPPKVDIRALFAAIEAAIPAPVPTGALFAFTDTTAPSGWLICDGSAVSRTTYAALWTFAQASDNIAADGADYTANPGKFGLGDGSTTFNVPNLAANGGQFIRAMPGTRTIGTYEADDNKAHTHAIALGVNTADGSDVSGGDNSLTGGTGHTASSGATEGRPRNTAYPWIIKT